MNEIKKIAYLLKFTRNYSTTLVREILSSDSPEEMLLRYYHSCEFAEKQWKAALEAWDEYLNDDSYHFISIFEEGFPSRLRSLETPPMGLFYQGELQLLSRPLLGVVGSRKLRDNVAQWCDLHLSAFLDRYPVPILSGAARGVDQLGHSLALQKGIPTVCVLPSGFHCLYPKNFQRISEKIVGQGGCLVTEYFPDQEVKAFQFHQRNRIISILSRLLLVLQAERKSGSLITANFTRMQGGAIAALPGDPTDPVFFGTNDLLAEGVHLLRDRDDLVCLFQRALVEA